MCSLTHNDVLAVLIAVVESRMPTSRDSYRNEMKHLDPARDEFISQVFSRVSRPMLRPRQAVLVLCCLCLSRAALLPVGSLRTRLSQCRAGVIRASAPDNVLTDEDALAAQRRVWALIFNFRSENEGIYTQQRGDGREYVLTWQAEEDAARYGEMLSDANTFPESTAVEMETQTLLDFCKEAGHTLCLVPSSTVVIPPDANVEEFEWTQGELEDSSLDAQEMTEENLKRRRKDLESMLGMDPGGADAE